MANTKNRKMTPEAAAQILGAPLSASTEDVTKAYRKLAMQWHPDRNQDNEEKAKSMMQQINMAYEVFKAYIAQRTQTQNVQRPKTGANDTKNDMYNRRRTNIDEDTVQSAWEKLQKAIHDMDVAQKEYQMADDKRNAARTAYVTAFRASFDARFGTPEYQQYQESIEKLYQELQQADVNARKCYAKIRSATVYKKYYEMEYMKARSKQKTR